MHCIASNPHTPHTPIHHTHTHTHMQEYKEAVVSYRSKLALIVRSAAAIMPAQALAAAQRRLTAAIAACAQR